MREHDAVITVENLSKRYLVGHQAARGDGLETLREMMVRNVRNFGRMALDMARGRELIQGDEVEEFWALREVSFEVRRGEVLGIIGSNGAGKSTLLKILSRITEPTGGRVRIVGRVASLLEVGTGFHAELSGRENIFLNGAILGMSRAEIGRKLDEIVDFAEVERFLDTPVKRYSSGMYMRLAFAVAAHLEPEILIVDEVLAVGDAAFQDKCLGKMQTVASRGRTVLFVSHNMQAVRQLCQRVIWLENGRVKQVGRADETIDRYLTGGDRTGSLQELSKAIAGAPVDPAFRLKSVDIQQDGVSMTDLLTGKPVHIRLAYDVLQDTRGLHVYFLLCDTDGSLIFESLHNGDAPEQLPMVACGSYVSTAVIPADFLAGRSYELQIQAGISSVRAFFEDPLAIRIHVHNAGVVNRAYTGYNTPGMLAPLIQWRTENRQQ